MPLIRANGRMIFFAHVPKVGGSSVEDYLIRRFGAPMSIITRRDRNKLSKRELITPATHLSAFELLELLPSDLAYCFAVVRDPVKRLQSQYRFQTGVSRMSRLGFSTWLRVMFAAARIDPRVYQNHIRPQSDLVPQEADVFYLENGFDDMIAAIDNATGTTAPEVEVGHLLKGQHRAMPVSRQDAELIANFYETDYKRFGYKPLDISLLPGDPLAGIRSLIAWPIARALVTKQHRDWIR